MTREECVLHLDELIKSMTDNYLIEGCYLDTEKQFNRTSIIKNLISIRQHFMFNSYNGFYAPVDQKVSLPCLPSE